MIRIGKKLFSIPLRFRARMHRVRGRLGKTEILLEKICALDPAHVEIALHLARIRTSRGRLAEARQGLVEALAPTGCAPAILVELAKMQVDAGELDSARKNLQKATERDAPAKDLRFLTARIEEQKGNNERAIELALDGLRENPQDFALRALSWRCTSRSVSSDAAAAMCEAFATQPDRSIAEILETSRFLRGMERWDLSMMILDRAATPDSAVQETAKEYAECLIGKNDFREASQLLEKILWTTPGDRSAAFLLARCAAELGNPEKALEHLEADAGKDLATIELKVDCHLRLADSSEGADIQVRKALSEIEDGHSNFPDHPNLVVLEIRALRRAGQKEDALSRAGRLSKTAIRGPVVDELFELYMECGHPDRAETLLSGLPEEHRRTIWYRIFHARLLRSKGRDAEADALLEDILSENPRHGPTLIELARLRVDVGLFSKAKHLLAETRASTGLPRDALIELARLQICDREYEAATDSLAEATRDGNLTVDALHLAAYLEERRGNIDRALEMAREGLRKHPGHVPFESMLWRCTSMSASHVDAEVLCEAYAARPDCSAEGLLEAAKFMRMLALWDKSLALLDRVEARNPRHPAVALERAQCLIDRRDPLNASMALREFARNSPGHRWAEILQAQCEANLGDARSALDRLNHLDPKFATHAAPTQIRAECLLMIGDLDVAEEQLDLLSDTDPETRAWAGLRKADLALSRGLAAEALAGIEKAVALDPDNMLLNQRHSMIRLLNGDFDGARDSNIAYVETRYASDVTKLLSRKERSSVHGRILNEFRLIGEDLPIAGYFSVRNPRRALPELRRLIEGHEDSTPAALAMLALMCRAGLVTETPPPAVARTAPIPRRIFQYWDEPEPPEQVVWLMEENARRAPDFEFRRFDRREGVGYLREKGEEDVVTSFRQAPNATARADILRLALLWHEGGIYLDADDRIVGSLDDLLPAGTDFVGYQDEYMCVANNFLAASAGHPVIRNALDSAVLAYFDYLTDELWLASGPGAITRAIAHRGTSPEGGLAPGIWIMPSYRLRPVVAAHVDLNYKATDSHWVKDLTSRRKS